MRPRLSRKRASPLCISVGISGSSSNAASTSSRSTSVLNSIALISSVYEMMENSRSIRYSRFCEAMYPRMYMGLHTHMAVLVSGAASLQVEYPAAHVDPTLPSRGKVCASALLSP